MASHVHASPHTSNPPSCSCPPSAAIDDSVLCRRLTSRRSESTSRCGFTLSRPYPSSSPRQHTPVPTHVYARTRVLLATERAIAHASGATFSISNLALLLASSSSCDSRAASTCTASPLSGRPEEEGWDSWSASSSPALEELLRCPPTPERTGVLGRGPPVPAAPVRSPVAAARTEPVLPPNSFENDSK